MPLLQAENWISTNWSNLVAAAFSGGVLGRAFPRRRRGRPPSPAHLGPQQPNRHRRRPLEDAGCHVRR
eukprot:13654803-Alexandrium_andersonii.AAC.1